MWGSFKLSYIPLRGDLSENAASKSIQLWQFEGTLPYLSKSFPQTMFKDLFKLRGPLSSRQKFVLGILGILLFLGVWFIASESMSSTNIKEIDYGDVDPLPVQDMLYYENDSLQGEHLDQLMAMSQSDLEKYGLVKTKIYPKVPPIHKVVGSYPSLMKDSDLLGNAASSLTVNLVAYIVAIILSLLIGFVMGLIPFFRGLFGQLFDAFRFIPLAAVTFVFVLLLKDGYGMKISFLAFGILVYLVPVVVQRIDEVKSVYLKMAHTLGATNWDTIRTVYFPSVLSRLSDDIRVLTAISWTYITVAEMVNNTGGLGGLIFKLRRMSNIEGAYAVLIVIILIGIMQDWILRLLDRWFFPHKHIENTHGKNQ